MRRRRRQFDSSICDKYSFGVIVLADDLKAAEKIWLGESVCLLESQNQ